MDPYPLSLGVCGERDRSREPPTVGSNRKRRARRWRLGAAVCVLATLPGCAALQEFIGDGTEYAVHGVAGAGAGLLLGFSWPFAAGTAIAVNWAAEEAGDIVSGTDRKRVPAGKALVDANSLGVPTTASQLLGMTDHWILIGIAVWIFGRDAIAGVRYMLTTGRENQDKLLKDVAWLISKERDRSGDPPG